MFLPSDKYSLLLLADYLEEFGSSYDIVKSTAIRNNKYNLNDKDKGFISNWENGVGWGNGFGSGEGIIFNNGTSFNFNESGDGSGNAEGYSEL